MGLVDNSHTWDPNCVHGNEWTGFFWLQHGVRSVWRVHVTPTLESIFKVFAKALKSYNLVKNVNLFFLFAL